MGETTLLHFLFVFIGGFSVGYLLYLLGFWAPGDAKLFWAMVIALPPTLAGETWTMEIPRSLIWKEVFFTLNAPLWSLLLNAVVSNFFLLGTVAAVQAAIKSRPKEWKISLSKSYRQLEFLMAVFGSCGIVVAAVMLLGQQWNLVHATIAAVVLVMFVEKVRSKKLQIAMGIPGVILGLYVSFNKYGTTDFLVLSLVTLSIVGVYEIIRSSHLGLLVQKIPIGSLQQGMISHVAVGGLPSADVNRKSYGNRRNKIRPGHPLTEKEIDSLRKLENRGRVRWIEVEVPIPFAPVLSLGVGITVLFKGSLALPITILLIEITA